jgi:uncharacterized protein with HEPN domain
MSNDEILDRLDLIAESIRLVHERFLKIRRAEDFVLTSGGVTLLDAIVMRLQVIGESVKQIMITNPSFLASYKELEWDKIAKFRDLVSHHYEHVDHEIVYDICDAHIPKLAKVVRQMRAVLSDSGTSKSGPP